LCLALMRADSEAEVIGILSAAGLWRTNEFGDSTAIGE